MAMSFKGDAIVTTITANINASDLTIALASSSGWPSGAGGKPFAAELVSADGTTHEKVLVASRSGLTLTVSARGYDDTVAASFLAGATIRHVFPATAAQAAADHIEDPSPHSGSDLLRPANHDLASRHTIGDGTNTSLLAGGVPVDIGTTASAGSGNSVARGNHTHVLNSSVAGAGLGLTAGVLAVLVDDSTLAISGDNVIVKAGGIGATQLASQAATKDKIGPDAIDGTKVEDDAIDSEHVVDGAIDPVHLAASLPRGNMATAERTSDSSDFASATVIPSFTATATPVSGSRIVEVEANLPITWDDASATENGSVRVEIIDSVGSAVIYNRIHRLATKGATSTIIAKRRYVPSNASHSWTVRLTPAGSATTVTVKATSGLPGQLTVNDTGGT